jgi:hypothetical protein
MALAPADFYAYSRATGVPVPEDPEERAEMVPEVLEFRRNQLRVPQEESSIPQLLGAGALGLVGLGAGYAGYRALAGRGIKNQPIVNSSPAAQAEYAQENEGLLKKVSVPLSRIAQNEQVIQEARKERPRGVVKADLTSFLQDIRQQEEFRNIGRPVTPYRPGSLADRTTREAMERQEERNPESPSYVSKLNERRQVRAQQAQQLANSVKDALLSGEQQEDYDLGTNQVQTAGSSSVAALNEAMERKQQNAIAPISRDWNEKLFDNRGMLRSDIISMHLGDENVIPKPIAQQLMSSAIKDNRGNVLSFNDSNAIFNATRHVRENLLAQDYQGSIKNYLAGETAGDIQAIQSRGFGWSARPASRTDVITLQTGEGGEPQISVQKRASSRYDVSDLEPLYLDASGNLIPKSAIGTSGTSDALTGTGIGEEIGQAVAFVPREKLGPFVATPGVTGEKELRYKQQGTGYAIGGVKEFGGSPGAGYTAGQDFSLPVMTPTELIQNKFVGMSSNGNVYAKVKPIALVGDSRLSARLNQEYGNIFYEHPITGQKWNSPEEAAAFVNNVHSQFNEKQLTKMRAQTETPETYRGAMEVALTGRDTANRQRKTWIDPYQKLSGTDEATFASQIQDSLLQKGLIQEAYTEDGAKYLRQTRYSVPELIEGKETTQLVLGPEHSGMFETTLGKGKKNNYEYLAAVQNAYQNITGNRLADIDLALDLRNQRVGPFLGGAGSNPYLNKALTVANTLTQISEPTRQLVRAPGQEEGLGERYGLGATVSEKPTRTLPSRQTSVPLVGASFEPIYEWNPEKNAMEYLGEQATYKTITKQVNPNEIGGKRLASALVDYRQRSGRPMKRSDFMQFASSIAQQEGADLNEVIQQAALFSRGKGQELATGKLMTQGRRALAAMDRPSPAEEVAQTIAEYDFGESIGSDIEKAVQGPLPVDIDAALTAKQVARAKVEPPGSQEIFSVDDQMLSNMMGKLRAQAGRRAGKRRSR